MNIPKFNSADEFLQQFNRTSVLSAELSETVFDIIQTVRKDGDSALRKYTSRFDGVDRASIGVTDADWDAVSDIDDETLNLFSGAAENIQVYHEKEAEQEQDWTLGDAKTYVGQRVTPLKRVGVYVPGGTAAYPSTVLMNVIPAKVAGVEEIALVSPPMKENGILNPLVLAAARILGVTEIYAVGGAQAVAALAYGTESIPPVDKIIGPGNQYVNEAKRQVFGQVGIESLAGPSEILIIADESANPEYLAADLLSQAEHDPQARPILIATDAELLERTDGELQSQLATLPRRDIAGASLENEGALIKVESLEEAIDLANFIAPEHLELDVAEPEKLMPKIRSAGCIFVGRYTPEPVGDYWAGSNHILPTAGSARYASALSVRDFIRRTSVVKYDEETLRNMGSEITRFARLEGLDAHARAVEQRTGKAVVNE